MVSIGYGAVMRDSGPFPNNSMFQSTKDEF